VDFVDGQGLTVKAIFIAGFGAALVASSTYDQQTQVVGQPVRAPAPMAPKDLRSHPNFGQPATKLPRAARAPSTPESRSAAALALSADPVFDEGTYQRIKETLLSCAATQVRGGWPAIPADTKLAPGASGPEVALLRKRLVISDDLAPEPSPTTWLFQKKRLFTTRLTRFRRCDRSEASKGTSRRAHLFRKQAAPACCASTGARASEPTRLGSGKPWPPAPMLEVFYLFQVPAAPALAVSYSSR
jgi:hypothetical protein